MADPDPRLLEYIRNHRALELLRNNPEAMKALQGFQPSPATVSALQAPGAWPSVIPPAPPPIDPQYGRAYDYIMSQPDVHGFNHPGGAAWLKSFPVDASGKPIPPSPTGPGSLYPEVPGGSTGPSLYEMIRPASRDVVGTPGQELRDLIFRTPIRTPQWLTNAGAKIAPVLRPVARAMPYAAVVGDVAQGAMEPDDVESQARRDASGAMPWQLMAMADAAAIRNPVVAPAAAMLHGEDFVNRAIAANMDEDFQKTNDIGFNGMSPEFRAMHRANQERFRKEHELQKAAGMGSSMTASPTFSDMFRGSESNPLSFNFLGSGGGTNDQQSVSITPPKSRTSFNPSSTGINSTTALVPPVTGPPASKGGPNLSDILGTRKAIGHLGTQAEKDALSSYVKSNPGLTDADIFHRFGVTPKTGQSVADFMFGR